MLNIYQEILMSHYRNPRKKGTLPDAHAIAHEENPSCGDRISIWVQVEEGILVQASFQGEGCIISQAAASMLLEVACGKGLKEIDVLDATFMKKLIGIELGPVRLKCGLLALIALQNTITLYRKGLSDAQSR